MSFWTQPAVMLVILSFYHGLEAVCVSRIKHSWPHTWRQWKDRLLLTWDYGLAMGLGVIEYSLEWWLLPGWKRHPLHYVSLALGTVGCLLGDSLRKWSILYNKDGFDHYVQETKLPGQTLITTGPYRICRHPAYAGWFAMAVSTQIILMNPVCFLVYWAWAYHFFKERIPEEETYLERMFPDYADYRRRTHSGVPFIR